MGNPGRRDGAWRLYEETALREVKEETGLTLTTLKLFNVFSGKEYFNQYPNGDKAYNALAVFISNDYEGELMISDGESTEQAFFHLNSLPQLSRITEKVLKLFVDQTILSAKQQ